MLIGARDRRVIASKKTLSADEDMVNGVHWKIIHIPGFGLKFEGKEDGRLFYLDSDDPPTLKLRISMESKLAAEAS